MLPLLAINEGQVGQRSRGAPWVGVNAERCERALIQGACGREVALFTGNIALLVGGPGRTVAISELPEDFRGFTQKSSTAVLNLDNDETALLAGELPAA